MHRSSPPRVVMVAIVLTLAFTLVAPVSAAPVATTDSPAEPSLVSLVLDWWSSLWSSVLSSSESPADAAGSGDRGAVVPPAGTDEASPMDDPVGSPGNDDEAGPWVDPVG